MEWTVKQLADRAGVTPRTLRHYHAIGLLAPDDVDPNGHRVYGPTAVARLQRILLLREAGMPLATIAEVLDLPEDDLSEVAALEEHLVALAAERAALDRRIASVQHTLQRRREGLPPRTDMVLEGFNDSWEDEVVSRWGRDAFDASHHWWHAKRPDEQRRWQADAEELLATWGRLQAAGHAPTDDEAQEHAARHVRWFAQIPGTPTHDGDGERSRPMVLGMANLYVADPAFHEALGGPAAARFAAEALHLHVDRTWPRRVDDVAPRTQ